MIISLPKPSSLILPFLNCSLLSFSISLYPHSPYPPPLYLLLSIIPLRCHSPPGAVGGEQVILLLEAEEETA
jgi:hypothetical protein